MRAVASALLTLSLASGVGLAERIADPFIHYSNNYILEVPQHPSEVPYVSSNWYDETNTKHDDRVGDFLLVSALVAGMGGMAIELNNGQQSLSTTS